MGIQNLFGAIFPTDGLGEYAFLSTIVNFLNDAIMPFTITLICAAAVFAICIAFAIMKAESGEKANDMKKRLMGLFFTIITIVVAVWILGFILSNYATIINAIRGR